MTADAVDCTPATPLGLARDRHDDMANAARRAAMRLVRRSRQWHDR